MGDRTLGLVAVTETTMGDRTLSLVAVTGTTMGYRKLGLVCYVENLLNWHNVTTHVVAAGLKKKGQKT
jgi:hypothetical protein